MCLGNADSIGALFGIHAVKMEFTFELESVIRGHQQVSCKLFLFSLQLSLASLLCSVTFLVLFCSPPKLTAIWTLAIAMLLTTQKAGQRIKPI